MGDLWSADVFLKAKIAARYKIRQILFVTVFHLFQSSDCGQDGATPSKILIKRNYLSILSLVLILSSLFLTNLLVTETKTPVVKQWWWTNEDKCVHTHTYDGFFQFQSIKSTHGFGHFTVKTLAQGAATVRTKLRATWLGEANFLPHTNNIRVCSFKGHSSRDFRVFSLMY